MTKTSKGWFPYMSYQDTQPRSMSLDVWTPMLTSNPSLHNKSLLASNQVAHVELLRGYARPVPQYAVTVTYGNHQHKKQKRFSVLRKKRAKP